jgi:phage baseplate assembly protein W
MRRDDFIGSGWAFPAAISRTGSVRLVSGTEEIDASIRMILSTVPGERVMRPDFGCGIHELVFDTITASTSGRVAAAVRDALLRFEPRIDVLDVKVDPGADGGLLLISIDYEVRATNNAFNLVYPFYLDGGAA